MYRMIVRRRVRSAFRHLSAGDFAYVLRMFGPRSVFCIPGDHPLGGELRGHDAVQEYFGRVNRLFPDLRFESLAVVVSGWPWDTLVGTRLAISATLPDGRLYTNEGMQFLRLRWGKVVEDRIYEDTLALAAALDVIAVHGNKEAAAVTVPQ